MRSALFTLLISIVLIHCSSQSSMLPPEVLYSLPHDERVVVYDAENDVVIAQSRQDDAKRNVEKIERDSDDFVERFTQVKAHLAEKNPDRLQTAGQVYDAKIEYFTQIFNVAIAALDTAKAQVEVARARLDWVRARQLLRLGRLSEREVKEFEDKLTNRERGAKDIDKFEVELRSKSQKSFTAWKNAEDAYEKSSGDFDALIWID